MRKRTLLLCVALLAVALVASCGGKSDEDDLKPPSGGAASGAGAGLDTSKFTATVSGKISFEGMPPANDKIQMSADPYCQQHAAENPTAETVKVSDGGLENVIVYVSSPVTGSFGTPNTAVEIDQHNCHYVPHVFTIMTNQTLKIKNSDDTLHNIHAFATVNEQYNKGQARKDMVNETSFPKAEMPLAFKCDVHKWMNSFAGVFDHPFHTVSKAGGAYELKLLPGKYEITAWHEKYGKKTMMVEVKDNEKKDLGFSFSVNDKAAD